MKKLILCLSLLTLSACAHYGRHGHHGGHSCGMQGKHQCEGGKCAMPKEGEKKGCCCEGSSEEKPAK